MTIDLCFPVLGRQLPIDHGYALYAALSAALPAVHDDSLVLGIAPVAGHSSGDGQLQLTERSLLRLRMAAERIPEALPLAGKPLDVSGCRIRLGVPSVHQLTHAASLFARTVTMKLATRSTEADVFLDAVQRRLVALGVQGTATIPTVKVGLRAGLPRRRVVRIKDRKIVGYSLLVDGLSPEDSLRLQEQADRKTAFSRRKLGCAFFHPLVDKG